MIDVIKTLYEDKCSCGFPLSRILFASPFGSYNYGLQTEESDLDTKIVVIPSFADLCTNNHNKSSSKRESPVGVVEVKDLRDYLNELQKLAFPPLEILFSPYMTNTYCFDGLKAIVLDWFEVNKGKTLDGLLGVAYASTKNPKRLYLFFRFLEAYSFLYSGGRIDQAIVSSGAYTPTLGDATLPSVDLKHLREDVSYAADVVSVGLEKYIGSIPRPTDNMFCDIPTMWEYNRRFQEWITTFMQSIMLS